MITYEIFELGDGFYGYRVAYDGSVFIVQTFAPGVGGFVPMTEADAHAYGQAQVDEMTPPLEEVPPPDAPADPEPVSG